MPGAGAATGRGLGRKGQAGMATGAGARNGFQMPQAAQVLNAGKNAIVVR